MQRDSVAGVSDEFATLNDLVAAGVADKTITVKNSPARNVHRLLNTIAFIREIFKGLYDGAGLKESVSGKRSPWLTDSASFIFQYLKLYTFSLEF